MYFNDPSGEFNLQPFFGNIIKCTSPLKPHYDPNDPNDGPWSFAGIYTLGQDAMFIGVAGAAVNYFKALRNGIIAENCNLTLRIAIFNAGAGTSLSGCNGYQIEQNFITATQQPLGTLNYAGITLQNSPNNFLGCNSVDGDFETNSAGGLYGPSGIRARASTNVEYDCNDVQDTYLGVQFDMGCEDTRLRATGFMNHQFGLHYSATAITGKQPADPPNGPPAKLHGNRWNGTWGGTNAIGARHENPNNANYVNLSQYIVLSIPAPEGPENPSAAQLELYRGQITDKMEAVMNIDSLLQTASGQDSIELLAQRTVVAQAIDSLSKLNTDLVNSTLQNRSNAADAVIAQNNAIGTSYIWESNEKTVNDILLHTLAKGLLPDSAETALLTGIAQQCPYDGGTAVFRARAILDGLSGQSFDDELLCAQKQQGLALPALVQDIQLQRIQLWPNPTERILTVQLEQAFNAELNATIQNVFGLPVSSVTIPENTTHFEVELPVVPTGIYWLIVRSQKGVVAVGKVVIRQ